MRKLLITLTLLVMTTASAFAMCAHNDTDKKMTVHFEADVIHSEVWTLNKGDRGCFKDHAGKLTYSHYLRPIDNAKLYYEAHIYVEDKHGGAHAKYIDGKLNLCSVRKDGSTVKCVEFKERAHLN